MYVWQFAVSKEICFCLYAIFSCLSVLLNLCFLTCCVSFYWLKLFLFLCPPFACSLCLNLSVYVSICFIICLTLTEQNGDLSLVRLFSFFLNSSISLKALEIGRVVCTGFSQYFTYAELNKTEPLFEIYRRFLIRSRVDLRQGIPNK